MIKSYQGIRVIAMMMIFFYHCVGLMNEGVSILIYRYFFYDGQFVVILFFILSGILTYLSIEKHTEEYKLKYSFCFAVKKIARMYPVYIITLIFIIAFNVNLLKNFGRLIISIFLIQSYIPNSEIYFSFNGGAWYLSSLLFSFLLAITFYKIINKLRLKQSISYMIIIYLIQVLLVIVFMKFKISHWLIYINPFMRSFQFFMGMLLVKIIKGNKICITTKTEIISVIGLVSAYLLGRYVNISFRYGVYYIPFILLVLYVFYFQKGIISRILSNKIFLKLSKISFEFYMIHHVIILKSQEFINNKKFSIIVSLVFSLIFATLLNRYITKKITNVMKESAFSNANVVVFDK